MRHRYGWTRLGRDSRHRRALLKNMATALIKHERIVTTLPKAKELRRTGDKMITLGKRGTPHAKKEAWHWMREPSLVTKLFGSLRQRYMSRPGGYTRVLKVPNRRGDNAPMAVVELVGNRFPPLEPARTGKPQKIFTTSSVPQKEGTLPFKNLNRAKNSKTNVSSQSVVVNSAPKSENSSQKTSRNVSKKFDIGTPV